MRKPSAPFLLVAAALAIGAPRAQAQPADQYVALGDSYSAGLGADRHPDSACGRSDFAFPRVVARSRPHTRLTFAACAGARVDDVIATQLGALTPATTLATLTVGGNDAGFADVVTRCALPAWLASCASRVSDAERFVRTALPARLDRLFARVRARAPHARVVVVGYPRLFGGDDCDLLTWFGRAERALLNAAADLLTATIGARAIASGFAFADPIAAFARHALCSETPWLNGLVAPLRASFHRNALGHGLGLAPLVRAIVG